VLQLHDKNCRTSQNLDYLVSCLFTIIFSKWRHYFRIGPFESSALWPSFLWSEGLQQRNKGFGTSAEVSCQWGGAYRSPQQLPLLTHLSPYSPDIAPSDYHRFGQLKESSVDEDLPVMMYPKTQFILSWQMEARQALHIMHWKRCHYVEKWNALHLSQTAAHEAVHWFTLLFGTSQQILLFHSW